MNTHGATELENTACRRVLVLGREKSASEATERYLKYCGHQVVRAADPESALAKAASLAPQVLICDLNVTSGRDRVRAAMQILEDYQSALVVISNYRSGQIRDRFPELKMSVCLRKPISLASLAEAVAATETG